MHPLLRYTLDLFGAAAAAPEPPLRGQQPSPKPAKPPRAPKVPKSATVTPGLAPAMLPAGAAPTDSATVAHGASLVGLAAPQFAHPQATRLVHLGGVLVAYALARGQRRTIGMVVGPEGLRVRAPRGTPLHEIDAALQAKARWIVRKLQEATVRRAQQLERQMVWEQGARVPFLGQRLCVQLVGTGRATRLGEAPHASALGALRPLEVALPASASAAQIRAAVRAWLMLQAQQVFTARLNHFAPLLQVRWKQLALSNAATRWGSARSDGAIRLNWRLMHFSLPVIDYVVAHELSHLRVMNHSPLFWETVRSVVPDYAALRLQLKDDSVPRW